MLLWGFGLAAAAQPGAAFFRISRTEGLADNYVISVAQDRSGFLWILTSNCLQRYDGHRFLNFYPGQGILPAGAIQAMHLDRQNRIWLCFRNLKAGYFKADDLSWHPVALDAPADAQGLEPSFHEWQHGAILLFLKGENILTLGKNDSFFSEKFNAFQPPPGWRPISFWQDASGNGWLSTSEGLVKFDLKKRQVSFRGRNTLSDPYIRMSENLTTINGFFIDKKGTGWIISWPPDGFRYVALDTNCRKTSDWQDTLLQGVGGKYFTLAGTVATGGEVWRYGENLLMKTDSQGSNTFFQSGQTGGQQIAYDVISGLFADRDGNIWLATNNGLYRYASTHPYLATYPNRRSDTGKNYYNDVTDFLEIAQDEIWVSTWGAGIFAYGRDMRPKRSPVLDKISKQLYGMVWSLIKTTDGDIWWAEQNGGLGHYDPAKDKVEKLRPPIVEGATIRQLTVDKQKRLWLGTQGGKVICFDSKKNHWTEVAKATHYITRLLVTPANEVWAGTFFDGIYRIDGNTLQVKNHYLQAVPAAGHTGGYTNDLCLYQDSLMLIASDGIRVLNIRTGLIRTYMPLSGVSNLATDRAGGIWAGSNGNLHLFSLAEGKSIFTLDENSGLGNVSFSEAATATLSDGSILFGTNHGFTHFDPERLKNSRLRAHPPAVLLSEFWINETMLAADSLQQLSELQLAPGNYALKLRYTTNSFRYPDTIYYKISGLQQHWRALPPGNELSISYPGPGNYLITAGVQTPPYGITTLHTLRLKIQPPFFRTAWFGILMTLLLLLLLFLLDRYRMKRREEVHGLRRKIAGQLHHDMSNTLEKINILSDIAIIKHRSDPVKSQEFISEIKSRSAVMMTSLQDMLWSIEPEHDSTDQLIARIEQFVQHAGSRYQERLEFAASDKTKAIKLNMQLRYELLLLFKTIVSNLMQAGAKNIYIYMERGKNCLNFTFQFLSSEQDEGKIINFLSSQKLLRRFSRLNAVIVPAHSRQASEISIKIPFRSGI